MKTFCKLLVTLGLLAGAALIPAGVQAQSINWVDHPILNQAGQPVGGAKITVCPSTATGFPCTPKSTVYSDIGLTVVSPNPLTADARGNYNFYTTAGNYLLTITGPGGIAYSEVITLYSGGGGGGGGTPAGNTGDFQQNTGQNFGIAPLHNTGTALQIGEPIDPTHAQNIAQKPNPSIQYVDAKQGTATGTDCQTQGSGSCKYFENAWANLWAFVANPPVFLQGGTIYLNDPAEFTILANSSNTTSTYPFYIIGPGDPGYAANCASPTLPTCTIGGIVWHKVPPTGVSIKCISGSLQLPIPAPWSNACILGFQVIESGVGANVAWDGVAFSASSNFPGFLDMYSSNGVYGDPLYSGGFDAPHIQNSVFNEDAQVGSVWMPAMAIADTIEGKFFNNYIEASSAGQAGAQVCNISSVARVSNVATFTCSAAHNFPSTFLGSSLVLPVEGVTDTTFNLYATVTVVDSTHLSMINNGPNATSSGGVIYGPAAYGVYMPGNPIGSNLSGQNAFSYTDLSSGGILATPGAGGGPGIGPIIEDHTLSETLQAGMARVTIAAGANSGGYDDLGGNTDADPQCLTNVCGGGVREYGYNGGLIPGSVQSMNDTGNNGGAVSLHSHFRSYAVNVTPKQTPELKDAAGFWNADVRAWWPGGDRAGGPVNVAYANQCDTAPADWTGTTVTAVPSHLDGPAGTGAGQVAAPVTFCTFSGTLHNGDRIIIKGGWNAQSAAGLPTNGTFQFESNASTSALYEYNGVEGGGLGQNYVSTGGGGQGEWEHFSKFLKAYTGTVSSASYVITFIGNANATHVMQYEFPTIEIIPATDPLTDEEVAMRARYEPLFSSLCSTGLCNPKTGGAIAGSGSVTSFSAGNLSPLFSTSVATSTSTPSLAFTLSTASANLVFGNCTSGTATPSYCAMVAAMEPSSTVNSFINDTNVHASISAQAATLSWSGTLAGARGGWGQALPSVTRAGDIFCYSGSAWITLAGNNSGTKFLSENSSGACSWASATGLSGLTTDGVLYATSATAAATTTPPTVNGQYSCGYSVTGGVALAPTCPLQGIAPRALTGSTTTDTVLYSDNEEFIVHDVGATGIIGQTLPTATTLGNAGFVYSYCNNSPQLDVITPTTWTINAASTLTVSGGYCYRIYPDPNSATNWLADRTGAGPADSQITVGTTTINANNCNTVATLSMPGLTVKMAASFSPTTDVSAVTGWGSNGGLVIVDWPTANTLHYYTCNQTGSNITPGGSVTFNVSVK